MLRIVALVAITGTVLSARPVAAQEHQRRNGNGYEPCPCETPTTTCRCDAWAVDISGAKGVWTFVEGRTRVIAARKAQRELAFGRFADATCGPGSSFVDDWCSTASEPYCRYCSESPEGRVRTTVIDEARVLLRRWAGDSSRAVRQLLKAAESDAGGLQSVGSVLKDYVDCLCNSKRRARELMDKLGQTVGPKPATNELLSELEAALGAVREAESRQSTAFERLPSGWKARPVAPAGPERAKSFTYARQLYENKTREEVRSAAFAWSDDDGFLRVRTSFELKEIRTNSREVRSRDRTESVADIAREVMTKAEVTSEERYNSQERLWSVRITCRERVLLESHTVVDRAYGDRPHFEETGSQSVSSVDLYFADEREAQAALAEIQALLAR